MPQVLKTELVEDPAFRNRQQQSEGAVSAGHFLHTYLSYIKCRKTVDRSLSMIANMSDALDKKATANKKPVKAQDLVRLYEAVLQNLNEMPQLAGLEEDLAFRQEVEAKTIFYKAWRCYYIARSFLAAQKWPEAMAIFQRATTYAAKAKADKTLGAELRADAERLAGEIEGRQFMAHANSILDSEAVKSRKEGHSVTSEDTAKALVDRLDVYYEDPKLMKGEARSKCIGAFAHGFYFKVESKSYMQVWRDLMAFIVNLAGEILHTFQSKLSLSLLFDEPRTIAHTTSF